jgi:hypothetical protein
LAVISLGENSNFFADNLITFSLGEPLPTTALQTAIPKTAYATSAAINVFLIMFFLLVVLKLRFQHW